MSGSKVILEDKVVDLLNDKYVEMNNIGIDLKKPDIIRNEEDDQYKIGYLKGYTDALNDLLK
jgi:hypothetical protein